MIRLITDDNNKLTYQPIAGLDTDINQLVWMPSHTMIVKQSRKKYCIAGCNDIDLKVVMLLWQYFLLEVILIIT